MPTSPDQKKFWENLLAKKVTRRDVVKGALVLGRGAFAVSMLAACGPIAAGPGPSETPTPQVSIPPRERTVKYPFGTSTPEPTLGSTLEPTPFPTATRTLEPTRTPVPTQTPKPERTPLSTILHEARGNVEGTEVAVRWGLDPSIQERTEQPFGDLTLNEAAFQRHGGAANILAEAQMKEWYDVCEIHSPGCQKEYPFPDFVRAVAAGRIAIPSMGLRENRQPPTIEPINVDPGKFAVVFTDRRSGAVKLTKDDGITIRQKSDGTTIVETGYPASRIYAQPDWLNVQADVTTQFLLQTELFNGSPDLFSGGQREIGALLPGSTEGQAKARRAVIDIERQLQQALFSVTIRGK